MNNFEEILAKQKIIGVIRSQDFAEAQKQITALQKAGLGLIEISLNSVDAFKLFEWTRQNWPNLCLGAASVLSVEQAQNAQRKGFDFLVSPITDCALMRFAIDQGLSFVPGACTPTEIAQVLKFYEFSLIKLFPASETYLGIQKVFPKVSFLLSSFPPEQMLSLAGAKYFAIGSFFTENLNLLSERINFIKSEIAPIPPLNRL